MAAQKEIPGMEREVNQKVEHAGELLVSATKKKTNANVAHKKAHDHLLAVMREEKVPEYTSEDLGKTFRIEDTEKVKVSAWENPNEGEKKSKKKGGAEDAH